MKKLAFIVLSLAFTACNKPAPVGFQGWVLVQATSVYNGYVELR
jgi:hypothetical protein